MRAISTPPSSCPRRRRRRRSPSPRRRPRPRPRQAGAPADAPSPAVASAAEGIAGDIAGSASAPSGASRPADSPEAPLRAPHRRCRPCPSCGTALRTRVGCAASSGRRLRLRRARAGRRAAPVRATARARHRVGRAHGRRRVPVARVASRLDARVHRGGGARARPLVTRKSTGGNASVSVRPEGQPVCCAGAGSVLHCGGSFPAPGSCLHSPGADSVQRR